MSSLADRLAAASRDRATTPTPNNALPTGETRSKSDAKEDAFRDLKA